MRAFLLTLVACTSVAVACGGGDAGTSGDPPEATLDGDAGSVTEGGEEKEEGGPEDAAPIDPAEDAGASGDWTTLLASAWQLTKGRGCEVNAAILHGLATDTAKPNRFVTVQDCMKGTGPAARWLIALDVDGASTVMQEIPLGDGAPLGVTITTAGRAVLAMTTTPSSTTPAITLAYHDASAASWLSATRSYSPFDGRAGTMAAHGAKILLAGERIFDVSNTADSSQWMMRGNDIPTNIASGLTFAWLAMDPSDPTQLLLGTELPLAVHACSIPAAGAGDASCTPTPAAQGLSDVYPAWKKVFTHPASLGTLWAVFSNVPTVFASADRGQTFAPLTLPAPCLAAETVTAFAGDPNDPKTFVIAQAAAPHARFFATRDGGATFHEVPAFPTATQNVDELAIDGTGALLAVSGGSVVRRSSF